METNDPQPYEPQGDEALEARIVAWVHGEASDAEQVELQSLCAARPELEAFRRRMVELHALLKDEAKPLNVAEWRLPAEKRAAVTALFEEDEIAAERRIQAIGRARITALAACIGMVGVAVFLLKPEWHERVEIDSTVTADFLPASPHPKKASAARELPSSRGMVLESQARGAAADEFSDHNTWSGKAAELEKSETKKTGTGTLTLNGATGNYSGSATTSGGVAAAPTPAPKTTAKRLELDALMDRAASAANFDDDASENRDRARKDVAKETLALRGQIGSLGDAREAGAKPKAGDTPVDTSVDDADRGGVAQQKGLPAKKLEDGRRVYAQGAPANVDLPPQENNFGEISALSELQSGALGGRSGGTGSGLGAGMSAGKEQPARQRTFAASESAAADQARFKSDSGDVSGGESKDRLAVREEIISGEKSDAPMDGQVGQITEGLRARDGAVTRESVTKGLKENNKQLAPAAPSSPPVPLATPVAGQPEPLALKTRALALNEPEEGELQELRKAVRDQQDKVEDKRRAVANIQRIKGIVFAGDESSTAGGPSEERRSNEMASDDYAKLEQQRNQLEAQTKTLLRYDGDQLTAYAAGLELPDNTLKTLYPQYLEQKVKLEATKATGLGVDHPTVRAQQEAMATMRKQLEENVTTLRGTLQAQLELADKRLAKQVELKEVRKGNAISSSIDRTDYVDAKRELLESQKQLEAMELKLAALRASKNEPAPKVQARVPVKDMDELTAAADPFSTFSLHVSDASFVAAKAAMDRGQRPEAESIRTEEFYNAFDYGDPAPAKGEAVACRIEQTAHPVLTQRNLVRVAMRTGASGRAASQPLHLTVLLDNSGSMEREDRKEGLIRAMQQLASLLGPNDRVTLAGFSRTPRLMAESVSGDRAKELVALVAQTPSEGGTNMEEAIRVGGQLALRQKKAGAQNRIVLLTDGAANLGNAKPDALAQQIAALRQQGIAFDAAGIGAGDANDQLLEQLTRNGDGRYYLIRGPEDADANFARKLAGAFRPAAENVKVQVHFNPDRVSRYKLIGFEKHRLNTEDFRNDKVDAAELAAEEAGVAIYQVETLPEGKGELGEVSVRFRDAARGEMVERTWTMTYDPRTPSFDRATPSMQLATFAMLTAEKLRGGPLGEAIDFSQLTPQLAQIRSHYAASVRVRDLATMIQQLR